MGITGSRKREAMPNNGRRTAKRKEPLSLALALRQPFAELVMSGKKKIEYRTRRTHIRGRVYVYAAAARHSAADEASLAKKYKLDMDALPRGVLVGTVEVYDCVESKKYDNEYEWKVRKPVRSKRLIRPTAMPQPGWFRPFKAKSAARRST